MKCGGESVGATVAKSDGEGGVKREGVWCGSAKCPSRDPEGVRSGGSGWKRERAEWGGGKIENGLEAGRGDSVVT